MTTKDFLTFLKCLRLCKCRELAVDVTRFNRHLLRSKLNWSDSHEESEIPSRIQG
jgi:hypothetical protein